jgi:hypothetical protein
MPETLYEVLHVQPESGDIQIKRAYRRLLFRHHPDTGDGNTDALRKIQDAYEVLSDLDKKKRYDAVIKILADQKKVEKQEEKRSQHLNWNPGVRNIPSRMSGSPSFHSPSPSRTIILRVNDVNSAGLTGLMVGQPVFVSGIPIFSSGSVGHIKNNPVIHLSPPVGVLYVPGKLTRVNYGVAPGLPVYGDFEVEIQ